MSLNLNFAVRRLVVLGLATLGKPQLTTEFEARAVGVKAL